MLADVVAWVQGFPLRDGTTLDLEVRRGEVVRLVGPNGSGKTSLLRALAGLDAPVRPASVRTAPAAFVLQRATDGLVGLTVAGEARLRDQDPSTALPPDQDVATLSSGEARRLALELARATLADLLLLDEPVEGLDAAGRRRLLAQVQGPSGGVVVVDHDGSLASVAHRTVSLGEPGSGVGWTLPTDPAPILTGPVSWGAGFFAITGPNGSGKTTLLRDWAGLLESTGIRVHGEPPDPGRTVRLLLPSATRSFRTARVRDELADAEAWVIDALVPPDLMDRHPWALSGGEARRVALAKVLGRPAPLYLLDEPEAHIDGDGLDRLGTVLARRIQEGSCIVAATHDPDILRAAHDRLHLGGAP